MMKRGSSASRGRVRSWEGHSMADELRVTATLRAEGKSEATVKSYLAHLRSALQWAVNVGLLPTLPAFPKVHRAKGGGRKRGRKMKGRPITGEEFDRMIAAVPKVVGERAADSWRFFLRGLWWTAARSETPRPAKSRKWSGTPRPTPAGGASEPGGLTGCSPRCSKPLCGTRASKPRSLTTWNWRPSGRPMRCGGRGRRQLAPLATPLATAPRQRGTGKKTALA